MKKALEDQQSFVEETELEALKTLAYQLDEFLASYESRCTSEIGTKIVQKIVWVFQTFDLQAKEMTLFRQLMYKSIARNDSCSREVIVWAFESFGELFQKAKPETQLFQESAAALTGILYAKSKNKVDPRPFSGCLTSIFDTIKNVFSTASDERQSKLLIFLIALFKGQQSLILEQWQLLFSDSSVLIKALDKPILREHALELLKEVADDSHGIFKQAIREPEVFYTQSLAMKQGSGILAVFRKLNAFVQLDNDMEKALYDAYAALLAAINWYNIRPPIKELLNMQQDSSLKVEIMLLQALRQDITSMYTFNKHKKGPFYLECLMRFQPSFLAEIQYLITYYENMDRIWYNMQQEEHSSKNMFANLDSLANEYSVDEIKESVGLIGSYLAIYPAFPIVADLCEPDERLEAFFCQDGSNLVQKLVELMGLAVRNEQLDWQQQLFNLELLESFVEYFQYGLNLSLGVLSKTPDEQTVNYQFQFYLAERDLSNLARPPTSQFITRALNDFYDEYVLEAIKAVLYSVNYSHASYVFFNVIYHMPVEIVDLLDEESLHELQAITLQACREPRADYSEYEQGRCLYALQNLMRFELQSMETTSAFLSDADEFVCAYLQQDNIAANLRKPMLQVVGMLIPQGLCCQKSVETVLQIALKENRSQSTALRVLGILFEQVRADLSFEHYPEVNLQQCLEICVSSGRSKSGIFVAAIIALRELFSRVETFEQFDRQRFALMQQDVCQAFSRRLDDTVEQLEGNGYELGGSNELNKLAFSLISALSKAPLNRAELYESLAAKIDSVFALKYTRSLHEPLIRLLHENAELGVLCKAPEIAHGIAEYEYRIEQRQRVVEYMSRYMSAEAGDEPK